MENFKNEEDSIKKIYGNENLKEIQEKWGGDTRKVFCDFYIDDKNLLPIILDYNKTP